MEDGALEPPPGDWLIEEEEDEAPVESLLLDCGPLGTLRVWRLRIR